MYKLSMSVDGEEINGGPLELDFTQPRQEQTRSDYTPASQNNHNHSTSVSRSQQNERNLVYSVKGSETVQSIA